MNPGPDASLARLVEQELRAESPPACRPFCDELQRRHGDALAAVLFYGSCLREASDEGVLDFYALVSDYHAAYTRRRLAWLNAALPPNVFYLECQGQRAKVAVVSLRDFARGVTLRAIRPALWARFCQPFAAPWLRDDAARAAVVEAAATALRTAVVRGLGLLPVTDGVARFDSQALWTGLFRETYASELRPESDERAGTLVQQSPQRYAAALEAVLAEMNRQGRLRYEREGGRFAVRDAPGLLARPRRLRRRLARGVGVAALLKSAFTFGDWMPYALWKLERHTGTRLEPSERQRRHPFLFAWPLIFRVLAKRELR